MEVTPSSPAQAAFDAEVVDNLNQLVQTVEDALRWLRFGPNSPQEEVVLLVKRVVTVIKNSLGILLLFADAIFVDPATAAANQEQFSNFMSSLPQLVIDVRAFLASRIQQRPMLAHALYGYEGFNTEEGRSPPLSFAAGQQIQIEADGDGWAKGSIDGRTGWFPLNLVTVIESSESRAIADNAQNDMSKIERGVEQIRLGFGNLCRRVLDGYFTFLELQRATLPLSQSDEQASRAVTSSVEIVTLHATTLEEQIQQRQLEELRPTTSQLLVDVFRLTTVANAAFNAVHYVLPAKPRPLSSAKSSSDMNTDEDTSSPYPVVETFKEMAQITCMVATLAQLCISNNSEPEDQEEFLRCLSSLGHEARRFVEMIQYSAQKLDSGSTPPLVNSNSSSSLYSFPSSSTFPPATATNLAQQVELAGRDSIDLNIIAALIAETSSQPQVKANTKEKRGRRPTSPWESVAPEDAQPQSAPPQEPPPVKARPRSRQPSNEKIGIGIKLSDQPTTPVPAAPKVFIRPQPATSPPVTPNSGPPTPSVSTAASIPPSTTSSASSSSSSSINTNTLTGTLPYSTERPNFTVTTQAVVRTLSHLMKFTQAEDKRQYISAADEVAKAVNNVLAQAARSASVFDDVMGDDIKRIQAQATNALVQSMQTIGVAARIASGVWPPKNAVEDLRQAALEVARCMKALLIVVDQIFDRANEYRQMLLALEQQQIQKDKEYWAEYLLFERVERDRIAMHKRQTLAATTQTTKRSNSVRGGFKSNFNSVGGTLTRRLVRNDLTQRRMSRAEMGSKLFQVNECIQAQVEALTTDTKDLIYEAERSPDGFPMIKAASLPRLVERLTYFYPDDGFSVAFLMTYEHFTNARELIQLLIQRFDYTLPDLTPKQYFYFKNEILTPIRLRVFNVFRIFFEKYFNSIEQDEKRAILQILTSFVETKMMEAMEPMAAEMKKLINNKMNILDGKIKEREDYFVPLTPESEIPPPILPKSLAEGEFTLEDLDPTEIARQLTLIEHRIFMEIRPREWLKQAWNRKDGDLRAPNIRRLIKRFNHVTRWVSHETMEGATPKQRAKMIKLFINIADKCRALNNFNAVNAILSGLQSAPIHRLKKSWELVSSKTMSTYAELAEMMSPEDNFNNLRMSLYSVNPPCVPWLGLYLRDLTFIEDGNPTKYKGTDLINFDKCRKLSNAIKEIEVIQVKRYSLQDVPEILSLLLDNDGHILEEKDQFERSLQIEPKET